MGNTCGATNKHKDDKESVSIEEDKQTQVVQYTTGGNSPKCKISTAGSNASATAVRKHNGSLPGMPTFSTPPSTVVVGPSLTGTNNNVVTINDTSRNNQNDVCPSPQSTVQHNLTLPEGINLLPDTYKRLLLGLLSIPRPLPKAKKIVIYVCAADSQDYKIEKGCLHNNVYPKLRESCRSRGYELHIVDLHWDTWVEKQRDHTFPQLCMSELNRHSEVSYIIPVIFMSNSLGISLLPCTIERRDFEGVMERTEDTDKSILGNWYSLRQQQYPTSYVLRNVSNYINPAIKKGSTTIEQEQALQQWNMEVEKILGLFIEAFPEHLRDTYLTTTLEQEIHNTVRMSEEIARNCIWIKREFMDLPSASSIDNPIELESKRRLDLLVKQLKNELNEKNILNVSVKWITGGLNMKHEPHSEYISNLNNLVKTRLTCLIDSVIDFDQSKQGGVHSSYYGVDKKLLRELMTQTTYCQKTALSHCSNHYQSVITDLKSFMSTTEEEGGIAVVFGPRASGKSTIIARFLDTCQGSKDNLSMVYRFSNISSASCSLDLILQSILSQLSYITNGRYISIPHKTSKYIEELPTLVSSLANDRPVLLVIDGIDQLRNKSTNWIPRCLPKNVMILISLSEPSDTLTSFKCTRQPRVKLFKVPVLYKNQPDALLNSLMSQSDSIGPALPDNLLKAARQCPIPFYIKTVANYHLWVRNELTEHHYKSDVNSMVNQMLDTLENILGKSKVQLTLSLLLCARYGLTDSEMLDILAHDEQFQNSTNYLLTWASASIFWSNFCRYLNSFLRWFETSHDIAVTFQDEFFVQSINQRYKDNIKNTTKLIHQYFKGDLWEESDPYELLARIISQPTQLNDRYNERKLEELPYLNHRLFSSLQLCYLEDHEWLYSKTCAVSVYQVLEDVKLETAALDKVNDNLSLIEKFLENRAVALSQDGKQFYTQLASFLQEPDEPISKTCNFYLRMSQVINNPPVSCFIRCQVKDESANENDKNKCKDGHYFDIITRVESDSSLVVTVSTEMQQILLWSIETLQVVRKVTDIPSPMDLKMIDSRRCVVLCQRELRMYDLDTGQLLTKLKGMMNQRMPYFEIHDNHHLVTLSRNRMYIHLMNLDTGDVVTQFKAGEDRFLNSLLVSGNGKVLVCGDETQKPFPLLVWDLTSRKLLYDFRIPHHDFITTTAAITYEGNYVCCVAKEVEEAVPNFIVLYDLQSGTLFKKWKSGVNCVSLDISSKDDCVLSGNENGTICVWDLLTGACKWILHGHNAPVNYIRLASEGNMFISLDKTGRDPSIRLWSLQNGSMLSVYTPIRPIIACELLSRGKIIIALQGHSDLIMLTLCLPVT